MAWDREVLEYIGDLADYISLHRYVGNRADDTADYLAVTASIDRQIEEMDAACRFVQAKQRSKKRAYLCFDEWNVWYKNHEMDGEGKHAPHLVEEVYNLEDALVVAGFLNSFVRHADVVKIANLAQIVNVIAPLQTRGDELLIQPTFYPFEMFAKRGKGVALQALVDGPCYEGATNGEVPFIDASAVLDGDTLHVFATNRSLAESAEVVVAFADRSIASVGPAEVLAGPDPKAANSYAQPDLVTARPFAGVRLAPGGAVLMVPPLSVVAVSLGLVP
jgi:alpha-N-arabinofuranosidase